MFLNDYIPKSILIIIICIICYYKTLWGGFVFDDTEAVINNGDINSNSSLINIFQNDFWGNDIKSNTSHKSYRPFTILFYRSIVYFAESINPVWFHGCNILLYIIVCILVYAYLKMIFKDDVAFPAVLLFTVHPVHTEVVASVVGCADLLCSLFYFISLICFHRSIIYDSKISFLTSLLSISIATFCKEIGIAALGVLIIMNVLYFIHDKKKITHRYTLRFFTICFTGIVLFYVRCKVMNFFQPTFQPADNPASFANHLSTRFLTYNYIYFINTLILIWPQWLCFDWSMGCIPLIEYIFDIRVAFVMFLWLIGIIFAYKMITKHSKSECIGLALLIIPFIPASNLLFRVGFVIAERVLFLPSIGMCLLITLGWRKLRKKLQTRALNILFSFVVISYMFRSHFRSAEWLNESKLFTSALEVCPDNAKVHYNIAKVAADGGDFKKAENEYRLAIKLYPNYDQALNNLANILRNNGKLEEAENLLVKAINIRSDFAAAWMNLGIVYATINKDDQAERCYKTALMHRKKYADCYYNLGNLYLKKSKNSEALRTWLYATELNIKHLAAWSNILVLLDRLERHDKVIEYGTLALESSPNAAAIHFTLANALGKIKKWTSAENHFKIAISLKPDNAIYYSNLGVLYHRWDKLDLAEKLYREALNIDPKMSTTVNNLNKIIKSNIK